MRVLVTGTSGMLGQVVANYLFDFHSTVGTSRTHSKDLKCPQITGDLSDEYYVNNLFKIFDPDVIVHCAACTSLNLCEREKELAKNINILATEMLSKHNSKFIYISTDSVYNEQLGDYKESSMTGPLNYYAWTKLQGELTSLKDKNTLVLRTNIYGLNSSSNTSLVEWCIKNLTTGKQITGYDDVYFNPVHTRQLAEAIGVLIDKNIKGILNISSSEKVSKYEFLVRMAKRLNLDFKLINRGAFVASAIERSKNTTLNNDKMKTLLEREYFLSDGLEMLRREYEVHTN